MNVVPNCIYIDLIVHNLWLINTLNDEILDAFSNVPVIHRADMLVVQGHGIPKK